MLGSLTPVQERKQLSYCSTIYNIVKGPQSTQAPKAFTWNLTFLSGPVSSLVGQKTRVWTPDTTTGSKCVLCLREEFRVHLIELTKDEHLC